jgi:ribosomal protein L37AE/L43A
MMDMLDNRFSRYDAKAAQIITGDAQNIWNQYKQHLVCPKCCSVMAFDGASDVGYCPRCHYKGKSITVSEFLHNKMYR